MIILELIKLFFLTGNVLIRETKKLSKLFLFIQTSDLVLRENFAPCSIARFKALFVE